MKYIICLGRPIGKLKSIVTAFLKSVVHLLKSAAKGVLQIVERVADAIVQFALGIVVSILAALVGYVLSFPIVGFYIYSGAAAILTTFETYSLLDHFGSVAWLVTIVIVAIMLHKQEWSRSFNLGCLAFALAFGIYVLPDRDTGQRAGRCPIDKSTIHREINMSLDNYELAPRRKAPEGYVYLIHDSDHSKLYNFGSTTDISTRLASINNDMPGQVNLIALLKVDFAAEYELKLRRKYTDSEDSHGWFDLTYEQLRDICNL